MQDVALLDAVWGKSVPNVGSGVGKAASSLSCSSALASCRSVSAYPASSLVWEGGGCERPNPRSPRGLESAPAAGAGLGQISERLAWQGSPLGQE